MGKDGRNESWQKGSLVVPANEFSPLQLIKAAVICVSGY